MDSRVVGVGLSTLISITMLGVGCDGDGEPTGGGLEAAGVDGLSATSRGVAAIEGFDVSITIAGADVRLAWDPHGVGAEYTVWRSADPYFEPGDPGSLARIEHANPTTYLDPVAGDGVHYYYRVVAHDAGVDELSTTVGKYAHPIFPGYNKIPQPLFTGLTNAAQLHAALGGLAASVVQWDQFTQSWQMWWPGRPGLPFAYVAGEVPIVSVGGVAPGTRFEQVGHVPAPQDLRIPIAVGHNVVTMPLSYGDTTASALLAAAATATRVGYWDPATQAQVWYDGLAGPDFAVEAGQDVYVTAVAAAVWPPDLPQGAWGPGTDPLEGLAPVQLVSGGHQFTEGALWHPVEQVLMFSDLQGDTLHRWDPAVGATELRAPGGGFTNGMTIDPAGNRIECRHATQRVVRVSPEGVEEVVASTWQGLPFNSPNDVIAGADGTLYFGDATIGAYPQFGNVQDMPLGFQGVYRIDPAGEVHLLDDGFADPTGVALSPDGRVLYVSDWTAGLLHAYPLAPDGTAGAGVVLTDQVPQADGMCVDAVGNIYVSMGSGLRVFRPDGGSWGTLAVPEIPANCAFGGDELQTLYITARSGVYAVETTIPGAPLRGW